MEAAVQMQMAQQAQAVQQSGYYRAVDGMGNGFAQVGAGGASGTEVQTTFDAMLMQLLESSGTQNAQTQQTLTEELKKELEENGTDAAMQMLAQLFLAQPTLTTQMDPAMLEAMTGGQLSGLMGAAGQNQPQNLQQILAVLQQSVTQGQGTEVSPEQFAKSLLEQAGMQVEVQQGSASAARQSESSLLEQAGFQRAVYQVKQMQGADASGGKRSDLESVLGGKGETSGTQSTEAAAQGVFAQQLTQAEQLQGVADTKLPSAEEIFAQVKTGITEGVQKGQNDFVIKLKPEGLGEITVRMTEQAGKMTMEIHASSQYTQRLLSSEIGSLRQVMEPYHVVVNTTQPGADSTSFGMEQQMRQGFAQQQNGSQPQHAFYAGPDGGAEQGQETALYGTETAPSSELDTYI